MIRILNESNSKWSAVLKELENDLEDCDPLYEQTSAGEVITDLMVEVEEKLGIWLEPSVQAGFGGIWVYSTDDDHEVAGNIDYETFNQDVCDIALSSKSPKQFMESYKNYVLNQIEQHRPDMDGPDMDGEDLSLNIDHNESNFEIEDSILRKYTGNDANVEIPNGVTKIYDYTFSDCTSLTSVVIPDSVTEISYSAFDHCTNLKSIKIPDNVTEISYCAFRGCENLTSIKIPDSVTYIGRYAFKDCPNLTVYCNSGSYAEQYCKEYDINYELM